MGTYTDFAIQVTLKADTPKSLIETLDKLINKRAEAFAEEDAALKVAL